MLTAYRLYHGQYFYQDISIFVCDNYSHDSVLHVRHERECLTMWGGAHIIGDPLHLNWEGLFFWHMLHIVFFVLTIALRLILKDKSNHKYSKRILISSMVVFVVTLPILVDAILSINPRLHLFARGIEGIAFLAVAFIGLTIPLYLYEKFLLEDNEVLS